MPIVAVQLCHLLRRDAVDEPVVVVAGVGIHREDLPVLRVHRDTDSLSEEVLVDTFLQLRLDQLLEAVIDREHHAVAGRRRRVRELFDLPLRRIALDLAPAVLPAKVLLVLVLETRAAGEVRLQIALVSQRRVFVFGHRTDIAEQWRIEHGIGVRADRLGLDAHAREQLRALREQERDVASDRPERDLDRLVRVARPLHVDRARDVLRVARNERCEALGEIGLLGARNVERNDGDGEAGQVAREHLAIAVDDRSTLRFDR